MSRAGEPSFCRMMLDPTSQYWRHKHECAQDPLKPDPLMKLKLIKSLMPYSKQVCFKTQFLKLFTITTFSVICRILLHIVLPTTSGELHCDNVLAWFLHSNLKQLIKQQPICDDQRADMPLVIELCPFPFTVCL